jgi:A/G-specific adenine glycosylase
VLAQPPIAEPARFRWLYRDEALTLGLPAPIRGLLTEPEQAALL